MTQVRSIFFAGVIGLSLFNSVYWARIDSNERQIVMAFSICCRRRIRRLVKICANLRSLMRLQKMRHV